MYRLLIAVLFGAPLCAAAADLESRYAEAMKFEDFLGSVHSHLEVWQGNADRASVPIDVEQSVELLRMNWRLLVVTEETCLDSANTLPFLAELTASQPRLEMRVLHRNRAEKLLRERPSYRGYGAVPTVIIIDPDGHEAGCWIEQPAAQREFQIEVLDRKLKKRERKKRVKEYLSWYEQDAGASTLREIVALLEAAERGARGCHASLNYKEL